nr:hypothetical protein Iba_chr14fCG9880 [Ipomoea batatas]
MPYSPQLIILRPEELSELCLRLKRKGAMNYKVISLHLSNLTSQFQVFSEFSLDRPGKRLDKFSTSSSAHLEGGNPRVCQQKVHLTGGRRRGDCLVFRSSISGGGGRVVVQRRRKSGGGRR